MNSILKNILNKNGKLNSQEREIMELHPILSYELLKNKKVNEDYPIFATEIRPSRCSMRNDGNSPCLTAKMGTGGNNVPVLVRENRKLTVRECLRLQGFPEACRLEVSASDVGGYRLTVVLRGVARKVDEVRACLSRVERSYAIGVLRILRRLSDDDIDTLVTALLHKGREVVESIRVE